MLKRNSKLITFLAIIMLFLTTTFTFAENEITTTSVEDTNTSTEQNAVAENTADTVQKDVYIFEDNINIDYIVEGNLFIFGSNVTVNEYVEGDVFAIGKNVTLNSEVISGNVFALGEALTVNSQLYDLYAAGNTITIGQNARIYRDAHIAASKINMFGAVVRNADFAFENISFGSGETKGIIYGNLTAETDVDKSVLSDSVYGTLTVNPSTSNDSYVDDSLDVKSVVESAVMAIASAIILYFIFKKLMPEFTEKLNEEVVSKKALGNFGIGLISLIAIPVASIILMILILTLPLAFLLLAAYIITLALANVIITIAIAKYFMKKFDISSILKELGIIALVSLALILIGYVPFLGGIVGFVKVMLALGLVTRTVFTKIFIKKDKEEEITITETEEQ